MTFTHAVSTNNYGPAKFIVSSSSSNGTHTTIQAAITAASSGDTVFIRADTYTENLTLKAGVNLTSFAGEGYSTPANVNIIGKMTFTAAGTINISNIHLQTNSDFILAVTGSAASIVNLNNCNLNMTNNTGISHTSSSASSNISLNNCTGDTGTTGITIFVSTSAGPIFLNYCPFGNSGNSTTASSASINGIYGEACSFVHPFSLTGTAFIRLNYCQMNTAGTNATAITINNATNVSFCWYCSFYTGTATAIVITAGLFVLQYGLIDTSNVAAMSGAGSLQWAGTLFSGTATITVTTTTAFPLVARQGGTGQSTYATGDILYASATNVLSKLAAGSNGTVLNLQSGLPVWGAQVAFSAFLGTSDSNVTGNGATYTLGSGNALTEIFDQGNNFNTNGTFTAPVSGKYYISFMITWLDLTVAMTDGTLTIRSSNRDYSTGTLNFGGVRTLGGSANIVRMNMSSLVDMDAADTVTFVTVISNGVGNTVDIQGTGAGVVTGVTGYLAC